MNKFVTYIADGIAISQGDVGVIKSQTDIEILSNRSLIIQVKMITETL